MICCLSAALVGICGAGVDSTYYSTSEEEVMFHVAPQMPTSAADKQQIMKKRRLGNDAVHIWWSHHPESAEQLFHHSTYTQVCIILSPVSLFGDVVARVRILTKKTIVPFGPLQDGMLLTARVLP